MTATNTKAKQQQKPAQAQQSTQVATRKESWPQFEAEIRQRQDEIATLLPSHINKERFLNTCIIAAKNNPDLMQCDRRSLHAALTKAAEDGLQPDGREGVINTYNEKRKVGNTETWTKVACWIPMTWGIRKRARELCGMIIDAQIVCEQDHFDYSLGDNPFIDHKPAKLGTPRGKMVGSYAIFKQDGEIVHREVMDAEQIGRVKQCVKAQNGLLWTRFEDEAWRKTVVRRGIKTVPSVPEALAKVVSRDDDQYQLDDRPARPKLLDVPNLPEQREQVTVQSEEDTQTDLFVQPEEYLSSLDEQLGTAETKEALEEMWGAYKTAGEKRLSEGDQKSAQALYDKHTERFTKGTQ